MIHTLALPLAPILNFPLIRRVRRNHGLEHATIHVLSQRHRNLSIAGRSTAAGFYLYGDVSTPEVESAAREALSRMQHGERGLAIHPNCGTGLVTAGVLTSVATMAGAARMKEDIGGRLARLPGIILLSTLALILAQPLGLALQQHVTTLGEPGELEVVDVRRSQFPVALRGQRMTVHFVRTRAG